MDPQIFHLDDSYEYVNFENSLSLNNCRHAAHCCIYSPNSFPIFVPYYSAAYIMMQMRFDGLLGFPGGMIDKSIVIIDSNAIVDGLNRELLEEINLDQKYFISEENHCFSHFHRGMNMCFHFFSKEVTVEDFLEIERNCLNADDFGKEVMGSIRIPLFTKKDGFMGFPAFLSNKFAGCSKSQLLNFLLNSKLVQYDYITDSLTKSEI